MIQKIQKIQNSSAQQKMANLSQFQFSTLFSPSLDSSSASRLLVVRFSFWPLGSNKFVHCCSFTLLAATNEKVSKYLSMHLAVPRTPLLSLSHSNFVTWPKQELRVLQLFFERKQVYPLLLFNIAANSEVLYLSLTASHNNLT